MGYIRMDTQTVLIAEDDYDIRQLLKIHIENAGYKVIEAKDGIEALEWVRNEDIHLLLLDIMMPRCNGFDVIKDLRGKSIYLPIIVLTAREEEDHKILGLQLGADDYICKPFSYREVLSRISGQLRRYVHYNNQLHHHESLNKIIQMVLLKLISLNLLLLKRAFNSPLIQKK